MLKNAAKKRKQILGWFLFFSLGWVSLLGASQALSVEASQIPAGQDVGATTRFEKTEKEQKAMMKKLSQKKAKAEIEGKEKIQQ